MKVRSGFVSNSSSSSFIVGVKPGTKTTQDLLMELFQVPQTSPIYRVARSVANYVVDNMAPYDIDEYLSDYGYDTLEEAVESGNSEVLAYHDLKEAGFEIYGFTVGNDYDDDIATMLYRSPIEVESDNFVMKNCEY